MSKAKLISLVFLVVAIGMFTFYGTYSWLKANDQTTSRMVIGFNDFSSIEEDYALPTVVVPGALINKSVAFVNDSNTSVYIRALVLISPTTTNNVPLASFCYLNCNDNTNDVGNNWIYNSSDGYYYYNIALTSGSLTTDLFSSVKVSDNITADDLLDFDVIIYAESTDGEGINSYTTAWGL